MENHSIRFLLHGLVKLPYLGIFNYVQKSHTLLMFIIIPNYTCTKIILLLINYFSTQRSLKLGSNF